MWFPVRRRKQLGERVRLLGLIASLRSLHTRAAGGSAGSPASMLCILSCFHCTKPAGDPLGLCTSSPKLTQKSPEKQTALKITSSDYKHESVKHNTHISTLLCLTLLRFCHSKKSQLIWLKRHIHVGWSAIPACRMTRRGTFCLWGLTALL